MSVVRGTALANYPSLVAGLGGDPATLLRAAGVRDQDVGNYDAFISIRAAIRAIESAAAVTATMDFGRRLAQRQGIEILGPVGGGGPPPPPPRTEVLRAAGSDVAEQVSYRTRRRGAPTDPDGSKLAPQVQRGDVDRE